MVREEWDPFLDWGEALWGDPDEAGDIEPLFLMSSLAVG